jgi:hypothetical protein
MPELTFHQWLTNALRDRVAEVFVDIRMLSDSILEMKKVTVGRTFGKVEVLSILDKTDAWKHRYWLCLCGHCGEEFEVVGHNLYRMKEPHCGCLSFELRGRAHRTHGMSDRVEYNSWTNMKMRCYNPNDAAYDDYGGRGIRVCDRWRFGEDGKSGFECFLEDMGPKPPDKRGIDRYPDNDGSYEPGNCRWATYAEQSLNVRANVNLTFNGKTQCISQWAKEIGMSKEGLWGRINAGYSVEEALTFKSGKWRDESKRGGPSKPLTVKGITRTLKEWAKDAGLPMSTIHGRLKHGWSPERAISTPIDPIKARAGHAGKLACLAKR